MNTSRKHAFTTTLGSCLICLRSADVDDSAEVDLGDSDCNDYLSEREAAVYLH